MTTAMSVFRCMYCDKRLSRYVLNRLLDFGNAHMCACGHWIDIMEVNVDTLPTSRKFEDHLTVLRSSWYHATSKADWYEQITDPANGCEGIHAGTLLSAKSRAKTEIYTHLFKLRLKSGFRLDPKIHVDVNRWELFSHSPAFAEVDAVRYVNRWESPGSISLLIRPTAFEIAEHTRLTTR